MTKFFKTLATINGILIPTVILFTVGNFIRLQYFGPKYEYKEPGTKVASTFVDTKGDTIVFQGIEYDAPTKIPCTNSYFMPVHPKVYYEPEVRKNYNNNVEFCALEKDIRNNYNSGYEEEDKDEWICDGNCANILYFDENFKLQKKLLDCKAHIQSFSMLDDRKKKGPKLPKYTILSIAFKDNDKNGIIDRIDNHDLYICDNLGNNLTQVSKYVDISFATFINSRTEMLIGYYERDGKKAEHKREKYRVYDIAKKTNKELSEIIKGLNEVEKILNTKTK